MQGVGAFKSVSQTIQRLEEAAVSYRGHERALLITRWLTVLKEIDRASEGSVKDKQISSEEPLASDEAKRREWVSFLFPFFMYKMKGKSLTKKSKILPHRKISRILLK